MSWTDVSLLGLAFAVSSLSALLAYRLGRGAWPREFRIRLSHSLAGRQDLPGEYGEVAVALAILVMAAVVDLYTPDVSLASLFAEHWRIVLPLFLLGAALLPIVQARSVSAAARQRGADPGYLVALRRGYAGYGPYAAINFLGGIACLALVREQIHLDRAPVEAQVIRLRGLIETLPLLEDHEVLRQVERLAGECLLLFRWGTDQVNLSLSLTVATMGLAVLLSATPLGQVFDRQARRAALAFAAIGGAVVVATATTVHVGIVGPAIDATMRALDLARTVYPDLPADVVRRLYETHLDLAELSGFRGLLFEVLSERGAIVLALGGLQFLVFLRKDLLGRRETH